VGSVAWAGNETTVHGLVAPRSVRFTVPTLVGADANLLPHHGIYVLFVLRGPGAYNWQAPPPLFARIIETPGVGGTCLRDDGHIIARNSAPNGLMLPAVSATAQPLVTGDLTESGFDVLGDLTVSVWVRLTCADSATGACPAEHQGVVTVGGGGPRSARCPSRCRTTRRTRPTWS